MYTSSALFSCPSPSGCPQPCYTSLGLSSATELQLCPQMGLDTQLHLSTALYGRVSTLGGTSTGSEQLLFYTDLQTQVRSLKGLLTTGSQQPSGPIILKSKDVTLSCLERATGSPKTSPEIDMGCSNTASLPGGRSCVLPFEFH